MGGQLTARTVASKKDTGRYADGGGLYLQISKFGTKAWIFRYTTGERTGKGYLKQFEMGLGSYPAISLATARDAVIEHRQILSNGKDPKLARDAKQQESKKNQVWTFDKCAAAYIKSHSQSWKNKNTQQWRNTLDRYASPVFGSLPVEDIDTPQVMQVIEPIWQTKNETASRVRGRIERVLSWAIVNKYRRHPNPAVWRGNLMELLPAPAKIAKPVHHPALPYAEIGIFMQSLEEHASLNAQALQFTILTACRTNEVLAASWDEINFKERIWIVPANRMKSDREHRIP